MKKVFKRNTRRIVWVFLIFAMILSACVGRAADDSSRNGGEAATETAVPAPSPTVTPESPVTLTICTASLPETLFPYQAGSSVSLNALLAMVGTRPYERIPSEQNGDLLLQSVSVQRGQPVVDARGELVTLKAGATVRPSGCRSSDCAIVWDGESVLEMDQMVVTFRLLDGLAWSDGTRVSAADSVFSFELASDLVAFGSGWVMDRTVRYSALDERTLEWVGKPGFTTAEMETLFWMPIPLHQFLDGLDWQNLDSEERFKAGSLSFGPFIIDRWEEGLIQLTRNVGYYRAEEGLPYLDIINLKVVEGAGSAIAALLDGACDVLDTSVGLENEPETLAELQADNRFDVLISQTGIWEQLVFGIQPAAYDLFYNPVYGDRPDFFGDARTRQAVSACLDREALIESGYSELVPVWPSFLPPDNTHLSEGTSIVYDPDGGLDLLEQVGWRDHDLDPETPLIAGVVTGIPAGTVFSLSLLIDSSPVHQRMAGVVRDSLAGCGIEVRVDTLPVNELYEPGPGGLVFGRQFDLTFVAWQPLAELDCGFYQSWRIPAEENQWIGTNIAGLVNDNYDKACADASLALPESSPGLITAAEEVFLSTLPAIPLFGHPDVMVIRRAQCGNFDFSSAEFFFENLDEFTGDASCP